MLVNSNILLLLLAPCVLRAASFAGANEFRSDYQYFPEASGWFKLHSVPADWQTARMQCYHEGAVLASPLNVELWSTLIKILGEVRPDIYRVFSGVHATLSDGVFSSVEGIPLEKLFVKWASFRPDNFNKNPQCLGYDIEGMDVYKCEDMMPYICYRKLSITDELTECGTVDQDYKLDARTGHCYKFHALAETWPRALRICQAEGGYLAVIDSEIEADLLKELFSKHPRLLYTPYQNSASVGFKEWGYRKSWWTIHGKLLEDTDFAQWSQGQPDDSGAAAGHRQTCGAIFRTGKLDDVWCDEQLAFICEKTKQSLIQTSDREVFLT